MKLFKLISFCLILIVGSCKNSDTIILSSQNKALRLEFNNDGSFSGIFKASENTNFLDASRSSYLMSLRIKNEYKTPTLMTLNDDVITLYYPNEVKAVIKYISSAAYLTFELLSIDSAEAVDLITWGPYYTTINETIGETVGVVRNKDFAFGIQALNIKTLGGFPYSEDDCMPEFDMFLQQDETDLQQDNKPHVLYRIEAAKPTRGGSSLQTFCRNRDKARVIENLNHERFIAEPYNDGGVIGSKIALFGSEEANALETIGKIEVNEGLPHPTANNVWMKTMRESASAYIIMPFDETTVDKAIAVTQQAGLKYLYQIGNTFKSWGHFEMDAKEFPKGYPSMKACVEKAAQKGINIGVHTLSNFIQTNDPYVTPVPDPRLAEVGFTTLSTAINEKQTEIEIQSPDYFNQYANNNLKTVRIGEELIQYGTVSESAPFKLLDCKRGAFGTKVSTHNSGERIAKLIDHAYKVFLSNTNLTIELSKNIANVYNQTGLKQISFDGLEGNKSTGLGNYGEALMPYTWYNNLNENIKDGLIIDASRTTHFFWHIYTRMNWGEPWYADFRESQTEYRMKNQAYFKRNYMPGMLGWFKMTSEISLEDMEWMLARTAAYDAGYAFVTSFKTLETHGQTNGILELIKQWERARLLNVFPEALKKEMEDLKNEYHLEATGNNTWNLYPLAMNIFSHDKKEVQPGEPHFSKFDFENNFEKQPLDITIKAADGTTAKNIVIELDNYKKITFPITLANKEIIQYKGGKTATIFDKNWKQIKQLDIATEVLEVAKGKHTLTVDADFTSANGSKLRVEVKTINTPIVLTAK